MDITFDGVPNQQNVKSILLHEHVLYPDMCRKRSGSAHRKPPGDQPDE